MKIAFWVLTFLVILAVGGSGFGDLFRAAPIVESITSLGYPVYFMTIIGVFKIAGVIALFIPQLRRFAYAGIAFLFIGAFSSHLLAGQGFDKAAAPLVILLLDAALTFVHRARFPYLYDMRNPERVPPANSA